MGSPPRVRGKERGPFAEPDSSGITPAYAGKSYTRTCYAYNVRDHPRVCGEKGGTGALAQYKVGSPPRMRGKVDVLPEIDPLIRITPAYAGKSTTACRIDTSNWDHPRVCGEKYQAGEAQRQSQGSPPRRRGKVIVSRNLCLLSGITPAYAGKRSGLLRSTTCAGDHPRVCGEKRICAKRIQQQQGSPPRMRGKVLAALMPTNALGITPAYAGKRLKRSHRIGHFSCILCLFHSVLHRASASGGSRAGPCAPPCLPAQNAVPV